MQALHVDTSPNPFMGSHCPPPLQLFARAPPPPQRHLPQPSPSLHLKHCCEKSTLVGKTGYYEHFLNVYLHYYKE